MILAGDIGGTNTRLALFNGSASKPAPVVIEVFPSAGRTGPGDIIREFLAKHDRPAAGAACFGIAGPVRNGICNTPNLPWTVNAAEAMKGSSELCLRALDLLEAIPVHVILNDKTALLGAGRLAMQM